jgi:hypothetical protein
MATTNNDIQDKHLNLRTTLPCPVTKAERNFSDKLVSKFAQLDALGRKGRAGYHF